MEKAIYLGEDSSGYKAACEGGKDSIYFFRTFRETGESFLEICPENNRNRNTFEALIQK